MSQVDKVKKQYSVDVLNAIARDDVINELPTTPDRCNVLVLNCGLAWLDMSVRYAPLAYKGEYVTPEFIAIIAEKFTPINLGILDNEHYHKPFDYLFLKQNGDDQKICNNNSPWAFEVCGALCGYEETYRLVYYCVIAGKRTQLSFELPKNVGKNAAKYSWSRRSMPRVGACTICHHALVNDGMKLIHYGNDQVAEVLHSTHFSGGVDGGGDFRFSWMLNSPAIGDEFTKELLALLFNETEKKS